MTYAYDDSTINIVLIIIIIFLPSVGVPEGVKKIR